MKILFVCTGNINRSAAAHKMAEKLYPSHEYRSAGTGQAASRNMLMAKNTREAVEAKGYETSHRSRAITSEDVEWADLIVCAAPIHAERIATQFELDGKAAQKIRQLAGYMGAERVIDPHFLGKEAARYCADIVEVCVVLMGVKEKL